MLASVHSGSPIREIPDPPDRLLRYRPVPPPPQPLATAATNRGAPTLDAASGVLLDLDSNTILWQRNPDQPLAPASTTKLMTALVAVESFPLDQRVTVTQFAANRFGVETKMGLLPGQVLTVQELITGMLKVSANDAAWAIADGTIGRDRFISTMNTEAGRLGMSHTHFENPVGYPDSPAHYSTARDLAVLAEVSSSRFPLLTQLAGAQDAVIPATASHPAFALHNVLALLYRDYPSVVAAKSGFTGAAGPCLVAMATRGGHHLVSVLLHAPLVFAHTSTLLDWGFTKEGLAPLLKASAPPSKRLLVRR